MTTYLYIKYDISNQVMNYLDAPTPGTADLLQGTDLTNKYVQDVLQNFTFDSKVPLPSTTYQDILDFLLDVPELNLNNSKDVILKIEFEDDEITGNVEIVSKNLDGTKTYITKGGWPIIIIKPFKFPTLGTCRDCLKLTFGSDNNYNFIGNLGGNWLGTYRNGQKQYQFFLPDYSQAAVTAGTYGTAKEYIIFWKPSVTYSGLDYFGQPLTINNQNKWVAVPSASIGTPAELSNTTFFHRNTYISGSTIENAVCPYYKSNSPLVPPYFNFIGRTGNYLLEATAGAISSPTLKPCPIFRPITGSVVWGYNCSDEGCVAGASGSTDYATLEECNINCQPPNTGSESTGSGEPEYGWACYGANTGNPYCIQVLLPSVYTTYATEEECAINCNPQYGVNCDPFTGQCIAGTALNTGSYDTYAECEAANCGGDPSPTPFSSTCSCDPETNLVPFGNFPFGPSGFAYGPGTMGTWNFNQGYAQGIVTTQFNTGSSGLIETSSMYLSKYEVLNVSCSYSLCFQAWQTTDVQSSTIVFDASTPSIGQPSTGTYPVPSTQIFNNLTSYPLAYSCSFVAGSPNFSFYLGVDAGEVGRINIDNICVKLIGCPPTASDCIISGSAYCYEEVEYDCLCPVGYTASLNGDCASTGSITVPQIITGLAYSASLVTSTAWGWGRPALYYNYNTNGTSPTSAGNLSPNFGNPRVYNTQFRYDLLSASMWTKPTTTPPTNLANTKMINYAGALSNVWYGGGAYLNVTSSKTYYAALIADDVFRLKLDGVTIVDTSAATNHSGPFNTMQQQSRLTSTNPYLPFNMGASNTNFSYHCYHIFPVNIPAGCHYLTFEAQQTNNNDKGFSGFIFDNTDIEIINANSLNDLNIYFDTTTDLIYDFNSVPITASCPPGTTPLGTSSCDLCATSLPSVPCGDCIECFNGILYNGLIVDAGGRSLLGRGFTPFPSNNTGIVNINPLDNPINTWYIPDEAAWDTLITYLNNNTAPSAVTGSLGSLGTVAGGKMKDYVRDLNASCWDFPNIGAQDSSNSSGWAGIGSGQRDDLGVYSGFGTDGYWWSANSVPTTIGNPPSNYNYLATRELKHWSNDVYKNVYTKSYGFSIRLVRPAVAGEVDGSTVFNAYKGNDGKFYDGIVIGTQVWITKNLAEQNQNNGSLVPGGVVQANVWSTLLINNVPAHNYYDNIFANTSSLDGNIDPVTGRCYEYPAFYIYQKCGGTETLIQEVSGSTLIPGKVQKAPDGTCWSFVEEVNTNPTINSSIYSLTNYFSGSNYVYDDCDECNAIHTIYTRFGTKNC